MKKIFTTVICQCLAIISFSQNVGVGTSTPSSTALLHVDLGASTTKGILITGTDNASSSVPNLGGGSRMMFYPGKAAFRSGAVTNTEWNNTNVGRYSFACGYGTIASDIYSVAMGINTTASGAWSVATGSLTVASGDGSTAMGGNTNASGPYSTTMGFGSGATAIYSISMGHSSEASGTSSIAMGLANNASGDFSIAIGNYVSTNGHVGALAIGDHSTSLQMLSATDNSFRARFDGGYRFYTSSDYTSNALLSGGDNAWSTSSDRNLKENFALINGEEILKKIAGFNLTSWNYKKQDPAKHRHYGPMAQDFFEAFGKDKYGTIGTDSTINQADFIGINFIAIQALEKRTILLDAENKKLREENKELKAIIKIIEKRIETLEKLGKL